ncbi:DUF2971 domain-containing protein [Aeromonas caviae]|uniref:DUF2971 domain-containing protein n=1 Tax=Aeromonas caviae TaxID=648 RepID=UPI002B459EF3|nr:DUF2971 domain-containing protein [Aeromonas caviae]
MMLFYKYTGRWKEFIENHQLRLTPPCDLNDPFEATPPLIDVLSQDSYPPSGVKDETRAIYFNGIIRSQSKNASSSRMPAVRTLGELGILSLSRCEPLNPKANLLWAHYANQYKGIAIEFDAGDAFFNDSQPVDYSNERCLCSKDSLADVFYKKHPSWEYEDEVRVVRTLKDADSFYYKCANSNKTERFELSDSKHKGKSLDSPNYFCCFEVPEVAIKRIYLGVYMPLEDKVYLLDLVQKNLKNCIVMDTMIDEHTYALRTQKFCPETARRIGGGWA